MAVQLLVELHIKFLDKSPKGGNRTFVCTHCGNKYNGSQTRQLAHLLGPKGKGIAVCTRIPEDLRQMLLAAVNKVSGTTAGPGSTRDAVGETDTQSRKRLRQQELSFNLKDSSCNSAQGHRIGNPASPAGKTPCRPDTEPASRKCAALVANQGPVAQQLTSATPQQPPLCESLVERDNMGQEAWALPPSAMESASGRRSPQQCAPARQDALNGESQARTAKSLPSIAAASGQQAGAGADHSSRDPRRQPPAERPASSAAPAASTSPPRLPMGACRLSHAAIDNGSVIAAPWGTAGRGAQPPQQPCTVFDCGEPVCAGAAPLTGPVTGHQKALSWQSQPEQQQCEGGLVQRRTQEAADRDSELDALQARVSRLESENQELAQKLADQTAAREEGRLRLAELSAELKVKDEHIKALMQLIKEGLVGQQR